MTNGKPTDNASRKRSTVSAPTPHVGIAYRPWLLALVLVVLTFIAYQPVWHAGFIWDDDQYVTGNTLLTAPDGLKHIWLSPPRNDSYLPQVNTTLRFEHRLWGLDPSGYHCVNILLHCLNALLVWAVLRRLALPGAWLAAAIWALHPVNVETVAWITELKNTQSTLFYLLTLLAWMKFTDAGTVRPWRYYALALILYGPALFSKPTACTLPAAMLLVLWLRKQPIHWRRLCQLVPFLCYGIAAGLLAVWCEHYLGSYAEAVRQSYSGLERLLIAAHALWFYAAKLAWPTKLTFSYPRWEISLRDPLQYGWLIACVAVAALLGWQRKAVGRGPIAAVVFFVAALSPLLGFIPVFTFRYSFVADHYQYLASMGLITLTASVGATICKQAGRQGARFGAVTAAIVLILLAALTWRQGHIYRDAETLWRDTLAKNPQSWMAHNNLGTLLINKGQLDESIWHYEQALRIKPDYAEAYYNLGAASKKAGRVQEAIQHYEQALQLKPNYAEAHSNLAAALLQTGNVQEAIGHWEQALRIKPELVGVYNNLGVALMGQGRLQEAIGHYEQALRIEPDNAEAHYNLGIALVRLGRMPEAIGHYERALRIKPDYVQAQYNLGNALLRVGKVQEAIGHYEQALRIQPNYADVHHNFGVALEKLGRTQEAIQHYEQALRIKPDFTQAQNALARLQAGQ